MKADSGLPPVKPRKDYSRLPQGVRLDETIAVVEVDGPPDPEAGRNMDQHRATQDS